VSESFVRNSQSSCQLIQHFLWLLNDTSSDVQSLSFEILSSIDPNVTTSSLSHDHTSLDNDELSLKVQIFKVFIFVCLFFKIVTKYILV
jgi:hypothetical protein